MDNIVYLVQIAIILFLGFLGGELVSKFKLPRVLGYIIIGMFIGPYAFGLIDLELAETAIFGLILAIAIGFVGLSVGSGINMEEIKEGGKKILIIGLIASFMPFALVALAMYYMFDFDVYSSLIIGSIALATSPITALSIINEYKVKGPVKDTLLLLAAIDDAIAIILFGVIVAFADSFYSGTGDVSFWAPFVELGVSVVVGLAFGYVLYLALKFLSDRNANKYLVLGVTVIFILLMLAVAHHVHGEALLAGITAGVVIYNMLSGKARELFESASKNTISLSVILALVLVGAMLDVQAMFSWFAIGGAIVYVLARGLGAISGASIGAKLARAQETVQKYLGYTLLAGAGVSLTFAGIAISVIPSEYGAKMGAIIAAAAIVNEILAVFATKWAFGKAGELGKAE